MSAIADRIIMTLKGFAKPEIAKQSEGYFKTGKGEYGSGDVFLGLRGPILREQVKLNKTITLEDIDQLLGSEFHEFRLLAIFFLVDQFQRGSESLKEEIFHYYLKNTQYINNWDIVDSSAYKIVGPYLEGKNHQLLYKLAQSKNLWERRIAIMSTFHFIRQHSFSTSLSLLEKLLNDKEDLIQKASGWMLREIGNRDQEVEEAFLLQHYQTMPRVMLRYAIEKFPADRRKEYLNGLVC